MNKKKAILLIGRGDTFRHYIQGMIDIFQNEYEVLVLEYKKEITYSNKHTRVHLPTTRNSNDPNFWGKVRSVEKEMGLNLFESYSNYLYYGRLAQEANIDHSSYWLSKDQLGLDYMQAYDFMKDMTDNYDIQFAFHDTIDLILLQMVEAFSKNKNFGFYHTLIKPGIFNNRALLSYGIARKSALFTKYLENGITPTPEETRIINEIISQFNETKPTLSYLKNYSQKLITLNEIKKIPIRLKNLPYGFKRLCNRLYLKKQTANFSLEAAGKYILFFLHHQPEATTTSAASQYVDQWKIVEELAIHGPSDINIIIKAHPFSYGWQGKKYYEKLLRLENVMMAPISYPGKELIQKAHAVITINGSIGLEALLYNTPAYTLGDAWYSHPKYIQNINSPRDLLSLLDAPTRLSEIEKLQVLASSYRASFDFFVDHSTKYATEKRNSGQNLANHVLENKEIYFSRVDI
ncbi:hypothetical protein [Desulfovibrio gilichinskyi]|uniref:Capsule polysaccharide biosynthesis protein n=1 Tax=Desulfovibrio gilichinskyi TaxID=1519643 RepID=A0A1X7EI74_9BACT|nr:hypothetical protein [Desulfovibrio gilichinskyi]SMF33981.1 Capsule polysaccharide biosynthesis protein [Desulfovibrio gilichinskyi]